MPEPTTWLVGMTNPYGPDPEFALYPRPRNAAGDRLCRVILGLTEARYLALFHRRNTMVGGWNIHLARRGALEVYSEIPKGHTVVLLGRLVWDAWRQILRPHSRDKTWGPFTQVLHDDSPYVLLPHPSGLSRVWNDPGSAIRAREAVSLASPGLRGELFPGS